MIHRQMPGVPLPEAVEEFLKAPRTAVVATLRDDGAPVTAAVWYRYADGNVHLSMGTQSRRAAHLREDPRLALTVLGESWYTHVSLLARVTSLVDDVDHTAIDALSVHYTGGPFSDPDRPSVSVTAVVERWHSFGEL